MRRLIIVAAAVAVLGLGALVIGGAATSAQQGEGPVGTFLSKVAAKLGVTQGELETAFKDARLEMIDEAVADGRLTEEQAQRLRDRIEEGGALLPPRPPEEGPVHPRPRACRGAEFVVGAAAEVLDMPKEELAQQLKDGRSLAQVAEAQGMDVEEFTSSLLHQVQTQLDAMVSEDKLTQEQADRIFQGIEENIDRIVNGHPRPDGPCRPDDGSQVCRGAEFVIGAAAEVLDIPKEELAQQLKDGNSLAQVAEAQGMDVEEFTSSLLHQVQTQLDAMVSEDKLTQEQADRIFQGIQENIDRIVNGHPRPDGPCRPRHGPRPFSPSDQGPRPFGPPTDGAFHVEPSDVGA